VVKDVLRVTALLLLVGFSAVVANAGVQTLTFDTPTLPEPGNGAPIPAAYGNLAWSNFYYLNGNTFNTDFGPSGYKTGIVSPNNVAYNGSGADAAISSSTAFDLVSGYFTAAFNTGLPVTVTGYHGASVVGSVTFTLNLSPSAAPVLETFNFDNVTRVVFSSKGCGTSPGCVPYGPYSDTGQGQQFVLDNLTISGAPTYTPEPASLMLLATGGLAAFQGWRKRRT
jgi:PEP-CTERM motif